MSFLEAATNVFPSNPSQKHLIVFFNMQLFGYTSRTVGKFGKTSLLYSGRAVRPKKKYNEFPKVEFKYLIL